MLTGWKQRRVVSEAPSNGKSAVQLIAAHDAVVEAWMRALEMKDSGNGGHTRRVTELAVRLAARSGFSEVDLVYVRWGAMLHDVGKMAVPDSVLGKPEPLDEREQAIMRQHPVSAYELLSRVEILRPALDIPYCHHERWDGCGYPRGLIGQQIPLAARIFAVVDVWDALRSDRPYRAELAESAARQIIEPSAGSLFDPDVVDLFLAMLARRNGYEPEAVKAIDDAAREARLVSYMHEVKSGRFARRERRSDAVMKVLEACDE